MNCLASTIDRLYERHRNHSQKIDWGYHRLLPWERGRNFTNDPWSNSQGSLTEELTIAVETAMLTETNLPWFTAGLNRVFTDGPSSLVRFVQDWTAEEDQHGRVLDVYLLLSRNGDPAIRNGLRKQVITLGWQPEDINPFAMMVYTTLQELATRVFYLKLARSVERHDAVLSKILRTIAKDETLHYAFYRDAAHAYIEEDPSRIATVCRIIPRFVMPGFGMPQFQRRLQIIAKHAQYGIPEYYHLVLQAVLSFWGVLDYELSARTREPRNELDQYLKKLQRITELKSAKAQR